MGSAWIGAIVRRFLLVFALVGIFFSVSAQDDDYCGDPSKKARKYFEQAEKMRFYGNDAYFLLKKALDEDEEFAEAYLELGNINYKRYKNAMQSRGYADKSSVNFERKFTEYYANAHPFLCLRASAPADKAGQLPSRLRLQNLY